MNAINGDVMSELGAMMKDAVNNEDVKGIIITGAGPKAFVAGADISQFQAFSDPQDAIDYERRTGEVTGRLERVRKPTIAMIIG